MGDSVFCVDDECGQSLLEVMIAIAIGALLLGVATISVNFMLRSKVVTKHHAIAAPLAQELLDNVASIGEARWLVLYNIPIKGDDILYYLTESSTSFSILPGSETIIKDGISYARSFSINNVSRDGMNNVISEGGGGINDPSTQKITVKVSWTLSDKISFITLNKFITRWKNFSFGQTDWSGGGGAIGPFRSDRGTHRYGAASSAIDTTSNPGSIQLNL